MAKVLVVDDSRIMRMTLSNMITELEHEVVAQAANGHESLEMYRKFQPDLVTMDITMPAQNGVEDGIAAVKLIREEFPKAKIVMVSSLGEKEKIIDAIRFGASNYLLKPIKIDKLESVFSKLGLK